MARFLGIEINLGKNVDKKMDEIEKKMDDIAYGNRIKVDPFKMAGSDNVLIPYYPLPMATLFEVAKTSDIVRTIHDAIKREIFKNGYKIEQKFAVKCEVCGIDYDNQVDECKKCGSNFLRKPDESQKLRLENFLETVNLNNQDLIQLSSWLNDDLETIDDMYAIMIKEYSIDENGEIIPDKTVCKEIVRGDPIYIRVVADRTGVPARTPDGKEIKTCIKHRDRVFYNETHCPICGTRLYPAYYRGETADNKYYYYIEGEVFHTSKYSPSFSYGYSVLFSVWMKVSTLLAQDDYLLKYYAKQRPPKGFLFFRTSNTQTLEKSWLWAMDMFKKNPHMVPPMGIDSPSSGSKFVEFIDLMKSPEEMQFIPLREEFRRIIGSAYGVMPIFQGDVQSSGGLNNESRQITVTNRAIEKGQEVFNKGFYKWLTKQLMITDYTLTLKPVEKSDELADLRIQEAKINNARLMQSMGFKVTMNNDNNFEFAPVGEPVEPSQPSGMLPEMANFSKELKKEKVYLNPNEPPPEGVSVQVGLRGGKYYESTGTQTGRKPEEAVSTLNFRPPQKENKEEFQKTEEAKKIGKILYKLNKLAKGVHGSYSDKIYELKYKMLQSYGIKKEEIHKITENNYLPLFANVYQLGDDSFHSAPFRRHEWIDQEANIEMRKRGYIPAVIKQYQMFDNVKKFYNDLYNGTPIYSIKMNENETSLIIVVNHSKREGYADLEEIKLPQNKMQAEIKKMFKEYKLYENEYNKKFSDMKIFFGKEFDKKLKPETVIPPQTSARDEVSNYDIETLKKIVSAMDFEGNIYSKNSAIEYIKILEEDKKRLNSEGKLLKSDMVTSDTNGVYNPRHDLQKILTDITDEIHKEENINIEINKADDDKLLDYLTKFIFRDNFSGMTTKQSDMIKNFIIGSMAKKHDINKMIEYIMSVSKADSNQAEMIARTESQAIQNAMREYNYKRIDPEDKLKYRWFGPDDDRTTKICTRIKSMTKDGVTLSELRKTIKQEGDPKTYQEHRPYSPHIGCRHTFIRVRNNG